MHAENKETPIFWGHGLADPVVLQSCQTSGVKALTEAGLKVRAESYAGLPHSAAPQEIDDVGDFLGEVLS